MPKVVDHDQRRAELVLALWQVIQEQGIDGETFRAVGQAAGVSSTTFRPRATWSCTAVGRWWRRR